MILEVIRLSTRQYVQMTGLSNANAIGLKTPEVHHEKQYISQCHPPQNMTD